MATALFGGCLLTSAISGVARADQSGAPAVRAMSASSDSEAPRPPPRAPRPEAARVDERYPGYLAGGIMSLATGVAFAAGGVVAAATSNPDTALGLTAIATTAAAIGTPLLLLGGTSEHPANEPRAAAGVALATPGVIGLGLGAIVLERRVASDAEPAVGVPLVIMGAGAAVAVVGVVLWATGASGATDARVALQLGPTAAAASGRW